MVTDKFKEMVKVYSGMQIEFPHLKPITVAQWMLESGRGTSYLAKEHNNFGGMMWRDEMANWPLIDISKVRYTSPSDGIDTYYATFCTITGWVKGYWKFIDRAVYAGWREHCQTGYEYISWLKKCGYAADPDYVTKVFALLPEANELLSNIKDDTHSEGETMPKVDLVSYSPNKSARNATLSHIVLHNTSGSYAGSVDWLCNPASQVSAHLVISRKGETAKLVPFEEKAWHAGNANPNSIGIEIEATNNQRGLTTAQEAKVIEWCKYLMATYKIKPANVIIHRMVGNTDCPVLIWPTNDDFFAWRKKNLEGEVTPPKPQPNEPEVTWFDFYRLENGALGVVGMNGSQAVVSARPATSLALVDFLKRWGDHSLKVAPEGKPWPGDSR